MPIRHLALAATLTLLAPVPARADGDPIARSRDRSRPPAEVRTGGKSAVTVAATAVACRHPPRTVPVVAPGKPAPPAGAAAGCLVISKDDGFPLAPGFGFEGRLAPAPGAAGPADFLAFRFATAELVRILPARITEVRLGLDNAFGRFVWPLVGIAREDPASPLVPGPGLLDSVTGFSDPLSLLPAPAVPGVPDALRRFTVTLPQGVDLVDEPAVDDGAWSDAFDRLDQPLDNPASDWLECDLAGCDPASRLALRAGAVRRIASGDALGVKFQAAAVEAVRPADDLDLELSVGYDVSAPGAEQAGLVFRIQSFQEFYLARYVRAANRLELLARTPAGLVPLADSGALPASATRGRLTVRVRGVVPTARIEVHLDGTPRIAFDDPVHTYAGRLAGIVALGSGSGETWDDFTVLRPPDHFAVVQLPPGEDSGVPADYSPGTVPFRNVLPSRDGAGWQPLAAERACRTPGRPDPANAFVSLAVVDPTDDLVNSLFQVESKLTTLLLDCAACPTTRNLCGADLGSHDRILPVFETGLDIDLRAGWWNEHALAVSRLMLRAQVFRGACGSGEPLLERDVLPFADPGQDPGGPAYITLGAPALVFTPEPDEAGDYCARVVEYYDLNADGCPDGWEAVPGAPCPAGCTCVPDPDENRATGFIDRRFQVVDPCPLVSGSLLVPGSLRLAPDPADPALTRLSWTRASGPIGSYNLHLTGDRRRLDFPTVRDELAPWSRTTATLAATEPLPAPAPLLYLVLHQNDGCPSGWSLPDP